MQHLKHTQSLLCLPAEYYRLMTSTITWLVYSCTSASMVIPPKYLTFFLRNNDVHGHDTRHANDLHVPYARLDIWKTFIKIHGANTWNDIPISIKQSPSLEVFKRQLRNYLTESKSCAWVHIGSSNGVLPDGTWPLHEPVLTLYMSGTVAFAWVHFCNEFPNYNYIESVQNDSLKLRPHLPGDSELNSTLPVSVYAFIATQHNICIEKHTSSFFFFCRFPSS